MRRQRSADEGGAERRQRQRERCCMQLPGELERRARLGELAGGQHDSDPQNGVEREDRRESRARGHREARPVRARTPATPDEPVETGHEPEQQRQVQRLLADRDRDRDPVLRVPGEHLLDRVPVGGRSGPANIAFWITIDAASAIAVAPTTRIVAAPAGLVSGPGRVPASGRCLISIRASSRSSRDPRWLVHRTSYTVL